MNTIPNTTNRLINKPIKHLILVCWCSLLPPLALAELTVIYDSGNTRPTAPYLKAHRIQLSEVPKPPDMGKVSIAHYPVKTTKLSLGPVEPQVVKLSPTFQPVFIVGSDELSQQWLQINQDRLLKLLAVGIVTEIESEARLRELKKQFPRLLFMPMSADTIAGFLPVKHYPVLITRDRIEQ